MAKVAILCTVLAVCDADVLLKTPIERPGVSTVSREQDAYGNYAFGYDIVDGRGASNSRSEVGDAHGNRKGSYTITDRDGKMRKVEYVADGHGFKVTFKTIESESAAKAPTTDLIANSYARPVAPVAVGHTSFAVAPIANGQTTDHTRVAASVSKKGATDFGLALRHSYETSLGHGYEAPLGHGYEAPLGHGYKTNLGHGYEAPLGHGYTTTLEHGYESTLGQEQGTRFYGGGLDGIGRNGDPHDDQPYKAGRHVGGFYRGKKGFIL